MQKREPRKKVDSQKKLAEMFMSVLTIGKKTVSERLKTVYGLKDNFQGNFVEHAFKLQALLGGGVLWPIDRFGWTNFAPVFPLCRILSVASKVCFLHSICLSACSF